jgi:MFS family permease
MRKLAPVLRHRDFRLLLGGQVVSLVGDALLPVALAFAVIDELDGGTGDVALVLGSQALGLGLVVLVAGVWADRVSRRALMLVSDIGRAAVQIALAATLLGDTATLGSTMALALGYGMLEALFRPAAAGLIPRLVPPAELQQANALYGVAFNIGFILGPVVGGVLVVAAGAGFAIAFDAATFLVSAAFLARLRVPPRHEPPRRERFRSELGGGLRAIAQRPWAGWGMATLGAYHLLALPALLGLGPVLADRELDGAASYATTVTAFGIGSMVGSVIALRVQPRRPMALSTGCFVLASCQPIAFALGGSTALIAAALCVCGVAVSTGFLQWETTLGRQIPDAQLSRVSSLDYFVTMLAMPAGYVLAGPLAGTVGLHETMVAGGALSALVALVARTTRGVRALGQESVAS